MKCDPLCLEIHQGKTIAVAWDLHERYVRMRIDELERNANEGRRDVVGSQILVRAAACTTLV